VMVGSCTLRYIVRPDRCYAFRHQVPVLRYSVHFHHWNVQAGFHGGVISRPTIPARFNYTTQGVRCSEVLRNEEANTPQSGDGKANISRNLEREIPVAPSFRTMLIRFTSPRKEWPGPYRLSYRIISGFSS
jgi:hypothetical protein